MNIELHTRKKMNDILQANPEQINENFDRMSKDLVDMADALGEYQIDLSSSDDVTGQLGVDNIDTDALASALDLTFAARHDAHRWCARQATISTIIDIGMNHTDSNAFGAAPDATTAWYQYTTPAAAGGQSGFNTNGSFARIVWGPTAYVYMKTGSSLANLRLWIGLASNSHTNVDTHAAHCASFRYSTVVPDAGFIGVTRDGTTQSTTSSIHSITTSNVYRLSITVNAAGTSVIFGVLDLTAGETTESTATLSANLPGSTIALNMAAMLFTTENVAKTWSLSRYYMQTN